MEFADVAGIKDVVDELQEVREIYFVFVTVSC